MSDIKLPVEDIDFSELLEAVRKAMSFLHVEMHAAYSDKKFIEARGLEDGVKLVGVLRLLLSGRSVAEAFLMQQFSSRSEISRVLGMDSMERKGIEERVCGCVVNKEGSPTLGPCGKPGVWSHPNYPEARFCTSCKELTASLHPDHWEFHGDAEVKEVVEEENLGFSLRDLLVTLSIVVGGIEMEENSGMHFLKKPHHPSGRKRIIRSLIDHIQGEDLDAKLSKNPFRVVGSNDQEGSE